MLRMDLSIRFGHGCLQLTKFEDYRGTKLHDLDDYWKNPKLNEKEKYLRDYILEKKYIDSDSESE